MEFLQMIRDFPREVFQEFRSGHLVMGTLGLLLVLALIAAPPFLVFLVTDVTGVPRYLEGGEVMAHVRYGATVFPVPAGPHWIVSVKTESGRICSVAVTSSRFSELKIGDHVDASVSVGRITGLCSGELR